MFLQDEGGLLRQHATPTYNIHASSHLPPVDEDYELAIQLQEDELEHYSARHPLRQHSEDEETPRQAFH